MKEACPPPQQGPAPNQKWQDSTVNHGGSWLKQCGWNSAGDRKIIAKLWRTGVKRIKTGQQLETKRYYGSISMNLIIIV